MNTIAIRQTHKYIQCQKQDYPQLQALLANIEHFLQNPIKVLKDDATSTVAVVCLKKRQVVIKRFNARNKWHFFRRLFSRSRAKKNWQNAHKLLTLGIRTFKPIALVEERYGPLKGRSYLLYDYLPGIDVFHYFCYATKPLQRKAMVFNLFKLIQQLAFHSISHRDLNLSNILLIKKQLWLIDLDGMRHHLWRWSARYGAYKERLRCMENWQKAPLSHEVIALFQSVFKRFNLLTQQR